MKLYILLSILFVSVNCGLLAQEIPKTEYDILESALKNQVQLLEDNFNDLTDRSILVGKADLIEKIISNFFNNIRDTIEADIQYAPKLRKKSMTEPVPIAKYLKDLEIIPKSRKVDISFGFKIIGISELCEIRADEWILAVSIEQIITDTSNNPKWINYFNDELRKRIVFVINPETTSDFYIKKIVYENSTLECINPVKIISNEELTEREIAAKESTIANLRRRLRNTEDQEAEINALMAEKEDLKKQRDGFENQRDSLQNAYYTLQFQKRTIQDSINLVKNQYETLADLYKEVRDSIQFERSEEIRKRREGERAIAAAKELYKTTEGYNSFSEDQKKSHYRSVYDTLMYHQDYMDWIAKRMMADIIYENKGQVTERLGYENSDMVRRVRDLLKDVAFEGNFEAKTHAEKLLANLTPEMFDKDVSRKLNQGNALFVQQDYSEAAKKFNTHRGRLYEDYESMYNYGLILLWNLGDMENHASVLNEDDFLKEDIKQRQEKGRRLLEQVYNVNYRSGRNKELGENLVAALDSASQVNENNPNHQADIKNNLMRSKQISELLNRIAVINDTLHDSRVSLRPKMRNDLENELGNKSEQVKDMVEQIQIPIEQLLRESREETDLAKLNQEFTLTITQLRATLETIDKAYEMAKEQAKEHNSRKQEVMVLKNRKDETERLIQKLENDIERAKDPNKAKVNMLTTAQSTVQALIKGLDGRQNEKLARKAEIALAKYYRN